MRFDAVAPFVPLPRAFRRLAFAVAAFVLPSATAAWAESDMTFQAVTIGDCARNCSSVISATGQITERTPEAFLDFLQRNGHANLHAVVFLDSPGGGVLASMQFGTMMRKVGAAAVIARVLPDGQGGTVIANGQCFSACVYALIGARKRVIPRESQVGIHRMFLSISGVDQATVEELRRSRFDADGVRNYLSRYTSRMGVSPDLIARAERIPSESLHILSRAEIRKWRLGVPDL